MNFCRKLQMTLLLLLLLCMAGFTDGGAKAYAFQSPAVITNAIKDVTNKDPGIVVTWDKSTKATGYNIYRRKSTESKYVRVKVVSSQTITSWTDSNVVDGTKYVYKVYPYNRRGEITNSVIRSITRKSTLGAVKSVENKTRVIRVEWNKASNITGYHIYRKKDGEKSFTRVAVVKSASTSSWDDEKTTDGIKYVYKVVPYNSKGEIKNSVTKSLVRKSTFGAVASVKNKERSIQVTWAKADNVSGYYVYRRTSSQSRFTRVKVISGASTLNWSDSNVKEGTRYIYKVCPYKKSGEIINSKTRAVTRRSTYGAIRSAVNKRNGITITWKKASSASGYRIYRRKTNESSYTLVKKISSSSRTSWTDETANNGVKYVYKVCPYDKSGEIRNSKIKTIARISTPAIRTLTSAEAGRFKITTTRNSKVSGYELRYYKAGNASSAKTIKISDVTRLNRSIKNLTRKETYYVKVRAFIKSGSRTWYSSYSYQKKVRISGYDTKYTCHVKTYLYKDKTKNSDKIMIWYMSEVKYIGVVKSNSYGKWIKVLYKGKPYYNWCYKNDQNFTKYKRSFRYTSKNKIEQQIIDTAMWYRSQPNRYDHGEYDKQIDPNGVYGFCCSCFVTSMINKVLQQYVPCYRLTSDLGVLYEEPVILNEGLKNQYKTKVVCTGEPDYDKMRPGDVIIFKLIKEGDDRPYNHCAIYVGNGEIIQCTGVYGGICIAPIKDMYKRAFVKALRFWPDEFRPANKTMTVVGNKVKYVYDTMEESRQIIAKLKGGTKVNVLYTGNKNRWAYIEYGDGEKGLIRLENLE